jgi:GNAT superfamily N-acetyltransferase
VTSSPRNRTKENTHTIRRVTASDLNDLLALMRAYCDFYKACPPDVDLLALAQALLDDPSREEIQLITRDTAGRAVGFATVYWSWATTSACRIGVMNDSFLTESARGHGVAEALIDACRTECTQHDARKLTWQTGPDNLRAQAVYERIGPTTERWVDDSLPS